jgi:CRISPR-associated protein Csb1
MIDLELLTGALRDRPSNDVAAIRFGDTYEPSGGPGAKVFPPTYAVPNNAEHPYVIESRWIDDVPTDTVLLDSVAAQANEVEQALLDAVDRGELSMPLVETTTEAHGQSIRITSLDAPHRLADAYFRDSQYDSDGNSTDFSSTEPGKGLRSATLRDATALFRWCPTALIYGIWDSHRGRPELSLKVPRSYVSELFGVEPQIGQRVGSRLDPIGMLGGNVVRSETPGDWSLVEVESEAGTEKVDAATGSKGKKDSLSQVGHGNVAPGISTGGVAIRRAERQASMSLAGLRRLRFPVQGERDAERDAAGRAVLAALALVGDRLSFDLPSLSLRSGCELVQNGSEVHLVHRDGQTEVVDLDADAALQLLGAAREAAAARGLDWAEQTLSLVPKANLQEAIEVNLPGLS